MTSPIDRASSVATREDLIAYLEELAAASRADGARVENPSTPDFIEASAAWLEG
ncbi:MAG TPA: hypothetical protein VGN37_08165 [Actinocatenispora sp.]